MHTLITPPQPPYPVGYIIDPVAFFIALIAAPLLFTAGTFWILFIPVFALGMGGPLYLLIGTPVLLWYLRRHDGNPNDIAILALMAIGVVTLLTVVVASITGNVQIFQGAIFYFGFGMIFGPAWAYLFGRIYHYLRREFFAKPRSL
jgi:hypothetical protein